MVVGFVLGSGGVVGGCRLRVDDVEGPLVGRRGCLVPAGFLLDVEGGGGAVGSVKRLLGGSQKTAHAPAGSHPSMYRGSYAPLGN